MNNGSNGERILFVVVMIIAAIVAGVMAVKENDKYTSAMKENDNCTSSGEVLVVKICSGNFSRSCHYMGGDH